jgi:uncharacterized protein (TIGR03435 family)
MLRAIMGLVVSVSAAIYAQTPVALRFEVASVKPANADPSSSGVKTGHGRLEAKNVTLKRCIMGAYGVGPHQISGGPDWLDSERFEILAKADTATDDDTVLMLMLQHLLAERFKLVLHREMKTLRALVLEVAKTGPKLEKAEAGEAGTNTSSTNKSITLDAHNTDMDLFARVLGREMDLPVVNHTELKGVFNFKLQWTPDKLRPADGGATEGASIFTAIQEQLGLRLRADRAPVEVLVIDRVEKLSEN